MEFLEDGRLELYDLDQDIGESKNLAQTNPTKAKEKSGWSPKVKFHELVRIMVDADLELMGLQHPGEGKQIIKERFEGWHRWEDQVKTMDK